MKNIIAFITIHVGTNFGSNLQTIATNKVLKKLGYESICVNYIPPRVSFQRFWSLGNTSLPQKVFRIIWKLYCFPLFIANKRIYEGYLKRHCALSAPIYEKDDFAEKCPKADVYMTGSDQSWNFKYNEGLDAHYFFDGIVGKKISYATSIGNDKLTQFEIECFNKYLPEYASLSVREKSARDLFKQLGFQAQHLIDPTFMLNCEEWKKYMSPRLVKDKYILVYIPYNITDKTLMYKSIRKIANNENLKVITFSWNYWGDKYADKTFRFANPGDFLSLMYYAECVVTNSFHGTAFSINLNKRFWVYLPSGFSTRIISLLDLCGLQDRLLENEIQDKQRVEDIDYAIVNKILEAEREKSIIYLKEALQ